MVSECEVKNFRVLTEKAISLLANGAELEIVYSLLKQSKPILEKLYANHPGPKINLEYDYWGDWHLETSIPGFDHNHFARFPTATSSAKPLPIEEQDELRDHLIKILRMWIDQDDLYSPPVAMKDVANLFDVDVRTLNNWIVANTITAFKVNKNIIRVLKSDLPK